MSELLTRETCVNHPERIGEALCDHCGNAMCPARMIEALTACWRPALLTTGTPPATVALT